MNDKQVMLDFVRICSRLDDLFTQAEAAEWLDSPHLQLDGAHPLALIMSGRAAEVFAVIDRMDGSATVQQ